MVEVRSKITDIAGAASFHLDLSFCRGEGIITSLFRRDRPHVAHVPYDFRVEHPQFQTRVISVGEGKASWFQLEQIPSGFDAKLVLREVELQPLRSR